MAAKRKHTELGIAMRNFTRFPEMPSYQDEQVAALANAIIPRLKQKMA